VAPYTLLIDYGLKDSLLDIICVPSPQGIDRLVEERSQQVIPVENSKSCVVGMEWML